jgi:type II secretory pathway pseudopilin PulG
MRPTSSTSEPPIAPVPRAARRGEQGYNLVILIVAITILNILVAVALPMWSYTIRRDREEETIFRGLQYAEAVRVFRQRFGRFPSSVEELVKVEPRSIRQLWKEPLSEDGEFGLVVEAATGQSSPQQAGGQPAAGQAGSPASSPGGEPVRLPPGVNAFGGFGIAGGAGGNRVAVNLVKLPRAKRGDPTLTSGAPMAIHGVYLDSKGKALRTFFGSDRYEQWVFTAELIAPPVTAPGRPLPLLRDDWIGKPFAKGLTPRLGVGGGGGEAPGVGGQEVGKGQAPKTGKPSEGEDGGSTLDEPFDLDQDQPPESMEEEPSDFDEPPPDEETPEDALAPEAPLPDDPMPEDDGDGAGASAGVSPR